MAVKTIDNFSLNHRRLFSLRPEPLSRSLEYSTLVGKSKRFYRSVHFRHHIFFQTELTILILGSKTVDHGKLRRLFITKHGL